MHGVSTSRSSRSSRAGSACHRLGLRQREHARSRSPPWSTPPMPRPRAASPAEDVADLVAGARRRRLGRRPRARPTSTSTTPSRPRSARRSAGPTAGSRVLYGFVNHELTTTYLGSSTGLRLRHVQPTGHYACTGKTADLRAERLGRAAPPATSRDVDALAAGGRGRDPARLGRAPGRPARRPLRHDPAAVAVADLMIDAYWSAGARVAHEGQSVYSRRGGGTRIGERIARPGRRPVLRPGVRRARVRPVRRRRAPPTTPSRSSTTACRSPAPTGSPTARWPPCCRPGTRAAMTGQPVTPMIDNLVLEVDGASGSDRRPGRRHRAGPAARPASGTSARSTRRPCCSPA